jgi:hypothetical protein
LGCGRKKNHITVTCPLPVCFPAVMMGWDSAVMVCFVVVFTAQIWGNQYLEKCRMNGIKFEVLPNIMLAMQITCRLRWRKSLKCIVHTMYLQEGIYCVNGKEIFKIEEIILIKVFSWVLFAKYCGGFIYPFLM